jgi:hypothetical protein
MRAITLGILGATLFVGVPGAHAANKCPNVVILLDASSSMNQPPDNTTTQSKISIARQVLSEVLLGDPDAGVPAPNPDVRFGFTYFPSATNCQPGPTNPMPAECGYGQNAAVVSAINAVPLHGSTPTSEAMNAVLATSDLQDSTRPRYLLIVTDGQPTCGNNPSGDAINAATTLFNAGVETFVVGFGSDVGTGTAVTTLNGMAANGQPPYPDGGSAQFYPATSSAALSAALSSILHQATGELGTSGCDPCNDVTCSAQQRCIVDGSGPHCVSDPCQGVTCNAGQFCRPENGTGNCVDGCPQGCPSGQACIDGQCATDPCAHGGCATCSFGQANTLDGGCANDLCIQITCPTSEPYCQYDTCYGASVLDAGHGTTGGTGTSGTTLPDGGHTTGSKATTSGCGCEPSSSISITWLMVMSVALLFGLSRARRSRAPRG